MRRNTFALKLKQGMMAEFRCGLGKVWQELTGLLDTYDIANFSIWIVQDIVFGYYESDDELVFSVEDKEKIAVWE